ncbi:Hypothetical predicted protein [Cloeon dipterum]|uniref:Cation-dependent mannose-6-phosphate receptor n=1 Tax=Cloeon dipterum TaxID=197152 RepID=A0A8S1DEC5_9INSE|nr:Hypothetical predicted protein [Cloeon dipterum]
MRLNIAFWGALLIVSCIVGWVSGQGYAYGPPSCQLLETCTCRFPWGRGFDLSNLTTLNVTLSSSLNETNGDTLIFNPCSSRQALNNSCPQNAAICKVSSNGKTTHILGLHENATISTVGANTLVQFSYVDDDNSTKSTSVKLVCAYNGEATTLAEDPAVPGRLLLTSKEVCSTDVPDAASDEMSSGATFLFIFFSLFAAYFFGGMAILKYIKGAQGVEMIPNYEFWTSLPSLVKDGFYFAMSGCRGSPSYDRI